MSVSVGALETFPQETFANFPVCVIRQSRRLVHLTRTRGRDNEIEHDLYGYNVPVGPALRLAAATGEEVLGPENDLIY
jgi:hypothetical protein